MIHHGDVRTILPTLKAGSVQCVMTSPPYWGLRSYLAEGHDQKAEELGLEPTPEAYVENMVQVFREVKRVLRDDGTMGHAGSILGIATRRACLPDRGNRAKSVSPLTTGLGLI